VLKVVNPSKLRIRLNLSSLTLNLLKSPYVIGCLYYAEKLVGVSGKQTGIQSNFASNLFSVKLIDENNLISDQLRDSNKLKMP